MKKALELLFVLAMVAMLVFGVGERGAGGRQPDLAPNLYRLHRNASQ